MIRFSMAHWITKRTAIRHAWRNNRADSGSPSGVNCQQHLDSEPVECLFRVRSLSDLYRETLWTLRRKSATWCTNRGNIWHRLYAAIMMGVVRCKMQDKRTVQAATFVLERTANYRKNKTHCIVQWSSVVSLRHCNTDIYIYIYWCKQCLCSLLIYVLEAWVYKSCRQTICRVPKGMDKILWDRTPYRLVHVC